MFDFADRHRGSYSDSLNSVVCPFYCSYSGYQVRRTKPFHRFFQCPSIGSSVTTYHLLLHGLRMSYCGELLGFIQLQKIPRIWLTSNQMATHLAQIMTIIRLVGMTNAPEQKFCLQRFFFSFLPFIPATQINKFVKLHAQCFSNATSHRVS